MVVGLWLFCIAILGSIECFLLVKTPVRSQKADGRTGESSCSHPPTVPGSSRSPSEKGQNQGISLCVVSTVIRDPSPPQGISIAPIGVSFSCIHSFPSAHLRLAEIHLWMLLHEVLQHILFLLFLARWFPLTLHLLIIHHFLHHASCLTVKIA